MNPTTCTQRQGLKRRRCLRLFPILGVIASWGLVVNAFAVEPLSLLLPEQKTIAIRDPDQLRRVETEPGPPPATVNDLQSTIPERPLSLDEAIAIGLVKSEVVRVLGGVTASTSGRSVYDVAIANSRIDQERAAFDPQLRANNAFNHLENPAAGLDPLNPGQSIISGISNDAYGLDFGLSQRNLTGGTTAIGVNPNSNRFDPGVFPLNPQNRSSVDVSYVQPLLRGFGTNANRVPIVLARIDTERSYFQYKSSVQQLVQGIIEAYWALVFAKTDLWAREQQVEQAEFANLRAMTRFEVGDANAREVAQTKLALENFRANALASQANVLQRQAALLNILGLPPYELERLTPTTPMVEEVIEVDWQAINDFAQTQRPDIIELKLVLEADQQRQRLADNQAKPQLDGVALYRWNGLEGVVPAGNRISTSPGQFTDWTMGVNFSVPLGLRRDRAVLRQQTLVIRRDEANLQQGLHQMQHLLALNVRNLEQFYAQYERFKAVRAAAKVNLDQQLASYSEGIEQFIVVLQAIVDWGNSVSNEAQALSQYNTELARLELQTGSILETHGIVFFEERFASIGPLGRLGPDHVYPATTVPSANTNRYPAGDRPSEENLDLEDPVSPDIKAEPAPGVKSDLDEQLEFKNIDQPTGKPMTDEEIDEILPKPAKSSSLRDLLRRSLRR